MDLSVITKITAILFRKSIALIAKVLNKHSKLHIFKKDRARVLFIEHPINNFNHRIIENLLLGCREFGGHFR